MRDFAFHRPASVSEAAGLLASGDREAMPLAGGHTLIPAMKARLRQPDLLVDLTRIAGLDAISYADDRLWIGATATHAAVAASAVVRRHIASLAALALLIGDPQVRARGTMGGAVANNDPASDYPAAMLALDAVVQTDRGVHAAQDFLQGMFATALGDGELIVRVGFRAPLAGHYAKFRHPASRYALAGVYVARHADGVRVAVTGAGYGASRWAEAEAALDAEFAVATVAGLTLDPADCAGDMHAGPEYRAHLAGVMLTDAVAAIAKGETA